MGKEPEVTLDYIKNLATQRKNDYSQLRTEQRTDDDLVEGLDEIGIQEPYHKVRTGKASAIIYTLAERIFTSNPEDTTDPKAHRKEEQRNTTRKLWINARMNQLMQEAPNAIDENKIKGPLRGEFYFKLTHNPEWLDLYYQEPKGKEEHEEWEASLVDKVPIIWTAPDPIVVYPSQVTDRGVPKDVLEIYNRTVEDVKASWPEWNNPNNKAVFSVSGSQSQTVEWVEFWRNDKRCFTADGEPVLKGGVQPNPYGFMNYVHMYAGFGRKSYEGKLETLARSILYPLRDYLKEQQRIESMIDSMLELYAHYIIKVRARTLEAARAEALRTRVEPGAIWEEVIDSNGRMELEKLIEKGPEIPQSLFAYRESLNNAIEERTFTSLLSGHATEGVISGVALSGRTDWARATYATFVKNLATGLSRAVGLELRMIEKFIKKPVSIQGIIPQGDKKILGVLSIKPEDINGNYDVRMEFKASDPERDAVRSTMGSRLYNTREISLYTNLSKYQGFNDPQSEIVRIEKERYLANSPMIQQVIDQKVAQDWGLEEELRQLEADQELLKKTPSPADVMTQQTANRKLGEPGANSGIPQLPRGQGL